MSEMRKFSDRALRYLEGVTDGTIMVLKGHLLLEEALYNLVATNCSDEESLMKAKLNFFRLLCLARAMHVSYAGDEKRAAMEAWVWDASEALNTLRNKLAHKLEPGDLEPLLRRISIAGPRTAATLSDPKTVDTVGTSIANLLGIIMAWTAGATE